MHCHSFKAGPTCFAGGRVLWYSRFFNDWEITRGTTVNMTQVRPSQGMHDCRPSCVRLPHITQHVATLITME